MHFKGARFLEGGRRGGWTETLNPSGKYIQEKLVGNLLMKSRPPTNQRGLTESMGRVLSHGPLIKNENQQGSQGRRGLMGVGGGKIQKEGRDIFSKRGLVEFLSNKNFGDL